MRSSPTSRSSSIRALAVAVGTAAALVTASCGGNSHHPAPLGNAGGGRGAAGGGLAARLPWEAALTAGATFTLPNQLDDSSGDESVTVKVVAVDEDGGARIYHLDWGDLPNGPSEIRVDGTTVTIGDSKPAEMKEPFTRPGSDVTCYGGDFSNPDGCDDVCDADLCLSSAGIVGVSGLYAPNFGMYGEE